MTPPRPPRRTSVDALRGLVMIIMALDHTREFFHSGAMAFSPEDLTKTTPVLFLTRWVTHICAPVFAFAAGMGIYLRLQREGSKRALAWFLVTRGLWIILIELVLMRLAMNFTFDPAYPVLLLVLWVLGWSMIAMAALIYVPLPVLAALSAAVILLHNTLDGVRAADLGAFSTTWKILHEQGVFMLAGVPIVVAYPLVPWTAVMAAGFCFGAVLEWEPSRRRRTFIVWGATLVAAFVVLRAVNVYGDPAPWSAQSTAAFTLLSFLRTTKYPPSLAFLLMTLGPALLFLAWLDRRPLSPRHPVVVIGSVPLFYYVVHFFLLHVMAAGLALARYGSGAFSFLFGPFPSMGGPRDLFPSDFGWPLWVVYLAWLAVVLVMYPLCVRFAALKRGGSRWAGYV